MNKDDTINDNDTVDYNIICLKNFKGGQTPWAPLSPLLFDGTLRSIKANVDQCLKHHTDIWYCFIRKQKRQD